MGTDHSISEIAIWILLWCIGMGLMLIVVRSFCKESRFESDSEFGTDNPVTEE
jgi:hypothetical protein